MRSIRWKIVLTSLLLVFIPIYLLNRYAIRFFDKFTRTELEQRLQHYAYLVGEQYKQTLNTPSPDIRDYLRRQLACNLKEYELEMNARFQILSPGGTVLFDSTAPGDPGHSLTNRVEIREALAGAYSARSRLSPDKQFMYYYIARPVKNSNKDTLGAVYVIRHTGPIIAAIQKMVSNQRAATQLSLLVAAITAALVAYTLSRRLRALTKATRDFAEGNAELNVNVSGGDEIARLGRAVQQMAHEIEARNRYNRDFITTTLHELKAPLTAIKGAAELLQQGADRNPESRAKFIGNINYQIDRMIRMTGELTELTRMDIEVLRGKKEPVDYPQFVKGVVGRLEPTFHEQRASFTCHVPEEAVMVMIVPERIEQVVSNLLENAFRYTPPDGQVTLSVEKDGNDAIVTHVSDRGCGIAAVNLDKVFDRFFTTERRGHSSEFGSGLGLAIARAIIENHRGRIWVESPWPQDVDTPDRPGTRFSFCLPLPPRHN